MGRQKLNHSYELRVRIYACLELWYNQTWSEIKQMETYPPHYHEPKFEPTAAQLERDRLLRRRTRLYIYLPLGIVSFIALVLIALILIGLFAPGIQGTEEFISAVADIIVILWIIPMIVLISLLPIAYVAYFVDRRQKRETRSADGSTGIPQPGTGSFMAYTSLYGPSPGQDR